VFKRFGLSRLLPAQRLIVTIIFTISCQFLQNINQVTIALILGAILLILNRSFPYKIFFFLAIFTTFSFLFVGNILFSPVDCIPSTSIWIFSINQCGIDQGLFHASKRTSMVLFGFAWLNATPPSEMADAFQTLLRPFFKNFSTYEKYIVVAFGLLEKLRIESNQFTQLLNIHNKGIKRNKLVSFKHKIWVSYIRLSYIILRLFSNIHRTAYAGEGKYNDHNLLKNYQISVQNLSASLLDSYNELAIEDISLNINEGEIIGLVSDDSLTTETFLRCISCYIPRFSGNMSGKLLIGNEPWGTCNKPFSILARSLKYISTDPFDFLVTSTVKQELRGYTKSLSEAKKALTDLGIEDLYNREINSLSGGQRARLILACILIDKPRIILMNNALTQLDPKARQLFIENIYNLHKKINCTIIIYDYFINELNYLLTRLIKFEKRKIIKDKLAPFCHEDFYINQSKRFTFDFKWTPPQIQSPVVCEAKQLSIIINDRQVIKDFNIRVKKGEYICVLGPNGSGKTTTMLALAGAINPTKGKIIRNAPISFSFQNSALQLLRPTVLEEFAVRPRIRNIQINNNEINYVIKSLGLQQDIETLDLTIEEKRKLAIATMLFDCGALIIDEPQNDLNLTQISQLFYSISELRNKGLAVIMITHDISHINNADQIIYF
jgi:energy-coupling factor transporter ATP-binding protein EcfA2/energy-coupling factor transporter transmembrane protein EcfT